MELNDDQKKALERWVKEGYGLSAIQKALSEEFGITMTYMDVRFLLLDAGLAVQDKPEKVKSPDVKEISGQVPGESDDISHAGAGGIQVGVDRITRPGSIVSGTVTFSDGKSGSWMLDQMGRIAIDVGDPSYSPGEADVALFQQELKNVLSKRGF